MRNPKSYFQYSEKKTAKDDDTQIFRAFKQLPHSFKKSNTFSQAVRLFLLEEECIFITDFIGGGF